MSTEKKVRRQTSSSSSSSQPEETKGDFKTWVNSLYTNLLTDDEIKTVYENLKYVGFDKNEVLEQLSKVFKETNLMSEVVIACALRGPVAAHTLKLSNGRTIASYGIAANGGRKSKILTCGKITAATADLAAFYLKKTNVPKRIGNMSCPGWLQFPAAGSIIMPDNYRNDHYEFSKEFSKLIDKRVGGGFSQQIYDQMVSNAYCESVIRTFLFG